uniref:GDSL esterase/lipase n=1 Tax=Oryza barthii TaxID=65489 RepID=A0A0D3GL03_9ORYZ
MVGMKKKSVGLGRLSLMISMVQVLGAVGGGGVHPSKMRLVPAVYVLGDSTLDVGNNNHLPGKDVPRANKPYYGIDFPGSKPTGRFSNGFNAADYVAKNLGFDKSPPAYLVLKARNYLVPAALVMGVNYASAGAGILDSTNTGRSIPLSKQVVYLNSTRAEMVAKAGCGAVSDLLAKSFFLFGVGSNDMFAFAAAQQKLNRSATPSEVEAFYTSLISNYSAAITELYGMGARKFGIINVGPVGCVPSVRVANATGGCNDGMNQLAAGFDAALRGHMSGLAGRLGAEGPCQRGAALCGDRDRFVFWDSVHPSQQANKLGAKAYFHGPPQFTSPINFNQLANYNS